MSKRLSSGLGWVVAQVVLWVVQLSLPFVWSFVGFPILAWGEAWTGCELAAAMALGGGGLALGWAAFQALGANLTPLPKPKEGSVLVVRGPYRVLRHPIYTAVVLVFLGWAVGWKEVVLVGLDGVLFLLFVFKSRLEERWLRERYPEYSRYEKTTGGLVPRLFGRTGGV